MASSSKNRPDSGGQLNVPSWFQAVIHPSKEEIYICPAFMKKYSSNMNLNYYGWIINTKRESTMVVFKWKDGRSYISDGRVVAKRNGFTNQRTVILNFEGRYNRFYMYPARISAVTNTLMPPPPNPYGNSSWSIRPKSYFKTTIHPKKEQIHICPSFMNNFESIIDIIQPALIKYHNNIEYSAIFNFTDDTWYFKNGCFAAQKFGFKVPTTVYLDFQFHDNRFNMTLAKPNSVVNPFAENKIILLSSDSDDHDDFENSDEHDGSDDEDEESDDETDGSDDEDDGSHDETDGSVEMDEYDDDDPYLFDVEITKSLAYTNQVMHFPNKTSRLVLGKNQTSIYLRDVDTRSLTKCTIKTSNRNPDEKYLGHGWYDFKKRLGLRPYDVLQVEVEEPPEYMNVKVVRRAAPSR